MQNAVYVCAMIYVVLYRLKILVDILDLFDLYGAVKVGWNHGKIARHRCAAHVGNFVHQTDL